MKKSEPYSDFESWLFAQGLGRKEIYKAIGIDYGATPSAEDMAKRRVYKRIIENPYELMSEKDIDVLSIKTGIPQATIRLRIRIGTKTTDEMSDAELAAYVRDEFQIR